MHKAGKRALVFLGATASFAAPFAAGWPQARGLKRQPLATEERIRSPGWWPTKTTPPHEEYVGPAACAECHSSEAAVQETTPMANACVRAADSKALQAHERLSFRLGSYTYEIVRTASGSLYSVSDGGRSVSAALGWAFGEGEVGETYVFERGGILYEGRLSYFPVLRALDFTPGQPHSTPPDLEGAIGRPLDSEGISAAPATAPGQT